MKETMTSRQRVMAAVNHEIPDRVPMGLGGHSASGISVYAYHNLRKYLHMDTDNIYVYQMVQGTAFVDDDIRELFHLDTTLLTPKWSNPIRWNPRGDYNFLISPSVKPELNNKGEWIVKRDSSQMKMPPNGYFFDGSWIVENDYSRQEEMWRDLKNSAERIYKETDYYTMIPNVLNSFSGDIEMACDMLTDPEDVIEIQERSLKKSLSNADQIFRHLGNHVQAVVLSGDLGTQTAPIMSPKNYETFCYPYLKKLCSYIHENSDLKIFLHSCGAIEPLIPYIADAGVDILNPVQISAANMDPAVLKMKYGNKITFWGGGCDTQNVINNGSISDIKTHVKDMINIFKKGSGYIFAQVHNVMGDIKPENIITMMETAYENSFY